MKDSFKYPIHTVLYKDLCWVEVIGHFYGNKEVPNCVNSYHLKELNRHPTKAWEGIIPVEEVHANWWKHPKLKQEI